MKQTNKKEIKKHLTEKKLQKLGQLIYSVNKSILRTYCVPCAVLDSKYTLTNVQFLSSGTYSLVKKHACQKYRYHRVSIKMMTFMKYNENRQRKTSKSFRKKMEKMGKVSEEEKMKLRTDVVSWACDYCSGPVFRRSLFWFNILLSPF